MPVETKAQPVAAASRFHVKESRFGVWFVGTNTWAIHVVRQAIEELDRLIARRRASYPVILDVGCGWGHALPLLAQRFRAQRLIAIDIDPAMVEATRRRLAALPVPVDVQLTRTSRLNLSAQSVDMIFCHQTFHHLVDQEETLREFHRVLKPGGILLMAELTKKFIHSWLIRFLFRHPMELQREASEFLSMLGAAGFEIETRAVSYPYHWWSRTDLGMVEFLFRIRPPPDQRDTLINLVATRPG